MRRKLVYGGLGLAVLVVAGLLIARALQSSLVYFVLPSEYARDAASLEGRRIRLGGLVQPGSVAFDAAQLQLTFLVTDSVQTYPVSYRGAPPDLFQENGGVVVEGRFQDGWFVGDNLLIKHSNEYAAPAEGEPVDVGALRESLQ